MLPPSLNNSQVPCPRLPSSAPTLQPQTPLPALCPPSHAPCPQQCFRGTPAFSWAGRSFLSLPSDFSQKYLPLWYPKGRRVPPTQVNGQVCVGVHPTPRHPSMQARDARAALHQRISSKPQHQARPPSRPLPQTRNADKSARHKRKTHLVQSPCCEAGSAPGPHVSLAMMSTEHSAGCCPSPTPGWASAARSGSVVWPGIKSPGSEAKER